MYSITLAVSDCPSCGLGSHRLVVKNRRKITETFSKQFNCTKCNMSRYAPIIQQTP